MPEAQRLRKERLQKWVWRGEQGANLLELYESCYEVSPKSSRKGKICTNLLKSVLFKAILLRSEGLAEWT